MRYGLSLVLCSAFLAVGCTSSLTPELIRELAIDKASFCARGDIRGGVGTLMSPSGGYGQSTLSFCRSNQANAKITLKPDGEITIQHGDGASEDPFPFD